MAFEVKRASLGTGPMRFQGDASWKGNICSVVDPAPLAMTDGLPQLNPPAPGFPCLSAL
jgi:hypothetical protein